MPDIADAPRDKQGRKQIGYNRYLDLVVKDEEVKDWLDRLDRQILVWDHLKANIAPPSIGRLKILDCGSGDGLFAHYLKTLGHDVIGIDINEKYVKYAQEQGRPVVYGDMCHLTYADENFDMTFSHQVLGLVKDRKTAIRERLRVTRRGGLLVALDHLQLNSQKHYQIMNKYQCSLMLDGIPDIEVLALESMKDLAKNAVLMVLRRL